MSTWPGDAIRTRDAGIGTLNLKLPELHPVCTICGCDCTSFRFEAFGFVGYPHAAEIVTITTCMDHFREPLDARLRAAS